MRFTNHPITGGITIMDHAWLPKGHHLGLHITHEPTGRGGTWVESGWKVCWHTTEDENFTNTKGVLLAKRAEPHFLIGREHGREHLSVVQFIPLTESSRALEHPPGTPETNRAHAVQVEVAAHAHTAPEWDDEFLRGLANLATLIEHRVPVPRKVPRTFKDTPHRFTPNGWLRVRGHVGHQHAPNQPTGHWDPGRFRARRMLGFMRAR